MSRITRALRAARGAFTPAERRRLARLAAAVVALHAVGWGLIAVYASSHPVLVGLGGLAYSFGLRPAYLAQRDVRLALESVLRVPGRLPVPPQHQALAPAQRPSP